MKSFTQNPEDFLSYGPLLNAEGHIILTPKNPRPINNAFTMRSPEIQTREQAMAMKGTQLFVPRSAFPEPDEDDFYYSDLVGLDVKSTDGKRIGKVVGVQDFGAGPMLDIQPVKTAENQNSFYHPFTKTAVPKVDIKAGRLIIHIEEAIMGRAPSSGPKLDDDDDESESEI